LKHVFLAVTAIEAFVFWYFRPIATSYRFPAPKNIVPYKRMMRQIKSSEKCFARNSFSAYENKTLDRENHAV